MSFINTILPFGSSLVSFGFAIVILRRYWQRKGLHLLLWGIGMIFYGIGGFCEGYYGLFGWNPFVFRMWYLFGAILVAAWLGQGTVYLLAKKKFAHGLMILLILSSIYGAIQVFGADLDPELMTASLHTGSEMSGHAIITSGVRSLTPFFNLYGTVALVGGAVYSAWTFWRKRVLLHRSIGNILIALGALLPAFGGTFSRMGLSGALYVSEFLGAILIFIGFVRATTPIDEVPASQPADQR